MSGFSIVSRQGPANLSFYAHGYDTLQTGGEEDVESAPGIFDEGVTGTTIGPDINSVVGVPAEKETESGIRFLAPSPNPASSNVNFVYYLPGPAEVELSVFDVNGRKVRALKQDRQPGGYHSTTWNGRGTDGRRVAAGAYLYRLVVDGKHAGERKVVIVR